MSQSQSNSKPSKMLFDELFDNFAMQGSGVITLENIGKWFEQSDLGEQFTTADISAEFSKIAKDKKEITKEEFQKMLGELAKAKDKTVEEIQAKLLGPEFQETTGSTSGNEATGVLDRVKNLVSGSDSQKETSGNKGREIIEEGSDKEKKEQSDEGEEKGLINRLTNLFSGIGSQTDEESKKDSNEEEGNEKSPAGQDTTDAA